MVADNELEYIGMSAGEAMQMIAKKAIEHRKDRSWSDDDGMPELAKVVLDLAAAVAETIEENNRRLLADVQRLIAGADR